MCESVGSASRTVHLLQVYIPLSHEMCIPRAQQHTAGIMWPKRMLEHHGGEPTAPWLTAAFYFRRLIRRCAARAERASKHHPARDACLQPPQADFSPQITALQISRHTHIAVVARVKCIVLASVAALATPAVKTVTRHHSGPAIKREFDMRHVNTNIRSRSFRPITACSKCSWVLPAYMRSHVVWPEQV